ncbi:hypothetical protein TRAPUB_8330 [Trametes pubescens]|uniref:Uncharacterized protein n=1 Tax=Trametes pubescens TaxID=154538 RepID=A0A1M2W5J6_TRAPU|nr:hypothetical protein TRAPUB_8330 [Trametes pubescens]
MNVIPGVIFAYVASIHTALRHYSLFEHCKVSGIILLSVLNSRKMFLTRGMEILDGKVLGRNIIARANQLAAAERWDVPQVRKPVYLCRSCTESDTAVGGTRSPITAPHLYRWVSRRRWRQTV